MEIRERLLKNRGQYKHDLDFLIHKMGSSPDIPKEEVYPKFDSIGRLAIIIEKDINDCISERSLYDKLLEHKHCKLPDKLENFLRQRLVRSAMAAKDKEEAPPTQEEVLEEFGPKEGSERNPDAPEYMNPLNCEEYLKISLDFNAFCMHSLVDLGLLKPGDTRLGVVGYKGRYLIFSSLDGIRAFVKDPAHYFLGIRETCFRNPELIQPLRLHEDFPKSSLTSILTKKEVTQEGST